MPGWQLDLGRVKDRVWNLRAPQQFLGVYELSTPSESIAWSGQQTLKSVRFELKADSISLSAGVGSFPIPNARACEIDGRYFVEQTNGNGTYSVFELSRFDQGLVFSALAVDLDKAVASGYKVHYLPSVNNLVERRGTSGESPAITYLGGSGNFILDNSHRAARDLLSVTTMMSYQMVLRSLPASTPVRPKVVFRMTSANLE